MYVSYLGLKQSPFRTAPDPDYFFASVQHLRAVDRVVHAIRERAGLVLVLGAIGQGKTTVCRYVQRRYRDEFLIGYLGNPFLDVQEFGRQILLEFGLSGDVSGSGDIVRVLTDFLREQDRKGRVVVLFLDEAHLLSPDVLEFLLIVTNIQQQGRHLLQMVLSGQNELQETLRQPRFSSLNQRLGNRIEVADFDRDDAGAYIRFRLDQAGGSGRELFAPSAVTRIFTVTRGNPRLINQMGERLLENAYEQRTDRIGPRDVDRLCASPVFSPILFPDKRRKKNVLMGPVITGTAVTVILVGIASTLFYGIPPGGRDAAHVVFPPGIFRNAIAGIPRTAGPGEPDPSVTFSMDASHRADVGVDEKLEKILQLLAVRQDPEPPEVVAEGTKNPHPATDKGRRQQAGVRTPVVGKKRAGSSGKQQADDHFVPAPSTASGGTSAPSMDEGLKTGATSLSPAPGIVVDAIVWDPLPRYRLAVVNERIVRQGDLAADGCTVEVILKDRIRLSLSGRMFENRVHGEK
jgi:type II secretory pathway predicted ATPase ExeA